MSQCRFTEECAFYNNKLSDIPNEGIFFKQLFCMKVPERCARMKASGRKDVSDYMNTITPLGLDYSTV